MATDRRVLRLGVLGVVTLVLFGALGTRMWFLQAADGEALIETLNRSRTKRVFIAPERGRIFDSAGRIVADNERVIKLVVDPIQLTRNVQRRREYFEKLAPFLGYESWIDLEIRYCGADPKNPLLPREPRRCGGRFDPRAPFPVADEVSEELAGMLLERREMFPGLSKDVGWRRKYPYAPIAAQVVGYMGSIPGVVDGVDLGKPYFDAGYQPNEKVGAAGIEKWFEEDLHGTWGWKVVRIDSNGNIVEEVPGRVEPSKGRDIYLTLDLSIQQFAEQALESQLLERRKENPYQRYINKPPKAFSAEFNYSAPAGSVVVERGNTGEIIAMASYPTFDPRWFGSGISSDKFAQIFPAYEMGSDGKPLLYADDHPKAGKPIPVRYSPFNNLAIQGRYNVGSTFKPFTAYAAITSGFIGQHTPYEDPSVYWIDPEFCNKKVFKCDYRNAINFNTGKPSYHGSIAVSDALALSTDTYFYRIGAETFLANRTDPPLQRVYRDFGFGEKSGIELPFEYKGIVPDAETKRRLADAGAISQDEGDGFFVGDSVQIAIGQGLLAVTPLQLTNAYAALSNGGRVLKPLVVRAILEPGTPDLTDGLADLSKAVVHFAYTPTVRRTLPMGNDIVGEIHNGLHRVIRGPGKVVDGDQKLPTGATLFADFPAEIDIRGKTGTAQGFGGWEENDSSAFVAYESGPDAYVIGAYLERAGYGSKGAAPLVKCLFLALRANYPKDDVILAEALDTNATTAAPVRSLNDRSCLALPSNVANGRER